MTKGEILLNLRVSLDVALGYVRAEKWRTPSSEFNAWRNEAKTPGHDTIDIPYIVDCIQIDWYSTEDIRGSVDIFHDRVIFCTYYIDTDARQKVDLSTFLDQGLTEENLFQYDVAYGFDGISTRDLSIMCKIAKLLVPPSEDDAYPNEMTL